MSPVPPERPECRVCLRGAEQVVDGAGPLCGAHADVVRAQVRAGRAVAEVLSALRGQITRESLVEISRDSGDCAEPGAS